jgi:hypothetical protein
MVLFSTAALACGGKAKYEMHLKKQDIKDAECVPLILEYPVVVEEFKQVDVRLRYDDGNGHFLSVDVEPDDLDKKDGILTTDICLAEAMLKHTSIEIEWYHRIERENGMFEFTMCYVTANTGDLYSLLKSGGTKEIDPSHYVP